MTKTARKIPGIERRGDSVRASVWSSEDGCKIRRTFSGRGALTAAKAWRSDMLSASNRGALRAPTRRTLREAAEAWIEAAKAGEILTRAGSPYKPSVLRGYEADLKRYVLPKLGAARLTEIRRRDLQALVDQIVGKGMSGSKVRNVVNSVRVVYRYSLRRDEVTENPTANLELPEIGGRRERAASVGEAVALVNALPEGDRALWAVACFAGLRRGELRALRDEDVDLEANVLHVRHGWDDVDGEIAPKSRKGERRVPIAATLRLYLLEHRARTGRRGTEFFFGRTASEPFTPTHVRRRALKAWAKWNAKEAERATKERRKPRVLEPIGLHEARHSFVSLMFDAGLSLERIGDYVGHGSAYMTDRYRHLLDGHEEEAAATFEAYLTRSANGPVLGQAKGRNSGV